MAGVRPAKPACFAANCLRHASPHVSVPTERLLGQDLHAPVQAERAAQQARDEAALRAETLVALAEQDRVDQMTAARRRMRVEEHRREAERLVAAKREAFERAQAWRLLPTSPFANMPASLLRRGPLLVSHEDAPSEPTYRCLEALLHSGSRMPCSMGNACAKWRPCSV